MKANSERAIRLILQHEGGFVDHPSDPGGATNRGVTLETFRRYVKPGGTVADLRAMSEDTAVMVFKRHYWDAVEADRLPSGLDYAVADFAVNSGPGRAARVLQAIVGVPVDGVIGPVTLRAASRPDAVGLVAQVCDRRLLFMQSLSNWRVFKNGWTARVSDVRRVAEQWASEPVATKAKPRRRWWRWWMPS